MSDEPKPLAPNIAAAFQGIRSAFITEHPLFGDLNVRPLRVGAGEMAVTLTPTEKFLDRGHVHSGMMTVFLDTLMGFVTWTMLDEFQPLATINLQTDTYSHCDANEEITCEAVCEGIMDDVSIVRGKVTAADGTLLATAAGTFMVGTRSAQVSRI